MSLYEIYVGYGKNAKWKQKLLRTRRGKDLSKLISERDMLIQQTKNVKGVDFVIAPSRTRFKGIEDIFSKSLKSRRRGT